MSILSNKINSYSIEKGFEFNEAYSATPTQTGSLSQITFAETQPSAISYSTDGPIGGSGSWLFSNTAGTSGPRLNATNQDLLNSINDYDWSFGFWFKLNSLPVTSSANNGIFSILPNSPSYPGISIGINGTTASANPSKLFVNFSSTNTSGRGPTLTTGTWYYLAGIRKTNNIVNLYLDDILIASHTYTVSAAETILGFGTAIPAPATFSYNISNFYFAPTSVIDTTQVSEIYSVGNSSTQNVSVLADVLTASSTTIQPLVSGSANINSIAFSISPIGIEPTVITTTSDSVNIVTSIPVNITIIAPISSLSLTIDIGTTLDASATLVDPIIGISVPVQITETAIEISATLPTDISVISDNQVAISATAYEVSATILNPSIISDNEVIIQAERIAASSEMPNPSFGEPLPDPLYWTAGTLQSKIATYPIEWGVEFTSTNYSSMPMYGSSITGTGHGFSASSIAPGSIVYESTVGPYASETGSLKFTVPYRLAPNSTTQAAVSSKWTDLNYTHGFWFKMNTLPTGTSAENLSLFRIATSTFASTSLDFSINVTGSSHATNPSKLSVSLGASAYDYIGTTLNTTDWHYLAVRRTGSAGVNNFEVYLDGALALVKTNSDTSTSYTRAWFSGAETAYNGSFNLQNYHLASAANLTSYEINQIWLAGTLFPPAEAVNAVHSADRFLATALSISPTVVAIKGDHVEVTTSVTVSSDFPEPSWSTGEIVKINVGSLGTILADIGDNIQIETNGDKSITPTAHIATAILVEPILSRQPMIATASLPMPQLFIAPNYFQLVMNHNPVFYIEDGQEQPTNHGSWPVDSWRVEYFDTDVQAGKEMDTIGNQKAWRGNSEGIILHTPELQASVPNYQTRINEIYATRSVTVEFWYKSIGWGSTVNPLVYEESGELFNDGITQIIEVWDFFGCAPGALEPAKKILLITERVTDYDINSINANASWRTYYDANPKRNEWNHIAIAYEPDVNPDKVRRKIYLNSAVVGNELLNITYNSLNNSGLSGVDDGNIRMEVQQPQNIWPGPMLGGGEQLGASQEIKFADGAMLDEIAIYPKTLSGTQILEHYNFIRSRTPEASYSSTAIDFLVEIGNHQVLPVQNALFDEDPMPALAARIPEPLIIGGKSKNLFNDTFEGSAEIITPGIETEVVKLVEPMIGFAEQVLPQVSNNYYYQYVQSNIAPYRYVSFDTNVESQDHGIDNDYSVLPTTIYGNITEYKDGINNKSVITSGTSYTDGVILNESEWDDSWGTGQNSYHSSFWFQRAEDDASTTGLRVLWNLNGYKDNQHVVLYQYQNKLHIQFNNGSGTWIEQDSGTLDLFDYERHFVLINFNHSNPVNNIVSVYVDSVLRMTIDLGAYTGSTTNASSADSGANNESNNHPRLGIGCLITPFAATALPVVPTNTRLILDEIYWDKNAITSTQVTNLYNAMPVKVKYRNYSQPFTATSLSVEPSISLGATFDATPMLAFPAQAEPAISTEYSIEILIDPFDATADLNEAKRSDSVNIISDLFFATFGFGSAGTPRIITATPLTASLSLVNRTVTGVETGQGNAILINGQRTFNPNSKWVQYVVSTTENTLIPMREVR